jgi:NAD(P)-dependent dehydrogenase (short-subunit alcohol dehydrogenase family)
MDKIDSQIVIFGGSGGLGTEVVKLMLDKYDVVCPSSQQVDVTNFKEVEEFFETVNPRVVIGLAGFNYDSFLHKIGPENIENILKVINVNAIGSLNIIACALKKMRSQNYGRIILVSSVLARKTVVGTSVYSASKAFIDNLVKTASAENISKGITCNSIQLGYFGGGMCNSMSPQNRDAIRDSIPLKRFGKITELYSIIEYLINNEYITGQNIEISGGI